MAKTTTVNKTVKEKTKKPTGFTITRNGNKFKGTWKIGDKNYEDGQELQFRYSHISEKKTLVIGKKQTSETRTIAFGKYYPNTGKILSKVKFRVRGNREEYKTTTKKKEKNGDTTKTVTTHSMQWSDWAEKTFAINKPKKPSLSVSLNDEYENVCRFTWSAANPSSGHRPASDIQWQSVLLKNSSVTSGKKAFSVKPKTAYSTGTSSDFSSSKTFTEDTSYVNGNNSYVRWFRVRTRGPAGASNWVYKKHVYAKPFAPSDVKAYYSEAVTPQVTVNWNISPTTTRPIDKMVVEKAIAIPGAMLAPTPSISPEEVVTLKYKDNTNSVKFPFRLEELDTDEVLWVRVTLYHDNQTKSSEWQIVDGAVAPLKPPVLDEVVYVESTHKVNISVSSFGTEIPGAFLLVTYMDDKRITPLGVGVIDPGETEATIQLPAWSSGTPKTIALTAYAGQYISQPMEYTGVQIMHSFAYSYPGKPLLHSNPVLESTVDIPRPPLNFTAKRSDTDGEIIASWSTGWTQAEGIELSWANSANAWNSTQAPDTFEVANTYDSIWNIVNLDLGKTYYVRGRHYKGKGDVKTYGPYCDPVVVSLSNMPSTPLLEISKPVLETQSNLFPEGTPSNFYINDPFTARWTYASTDGTSQKYAEICLATTDVDGNITYGDVIATTETAQHVDLLASDIGGQLGTYELCVRVASTGGELSEWSKPATVTLVNPISMDVTNTNLVVDLETDTITMVELPLTLTVTGAGDTGTTSVTIQREESYYLDRPDERNYTGHKGEIIASYSQLGESPISITKDDLIGTLDDGALYALVITVTNGLGQTGKIERVFSVNWRHQAYFSTAQIEYDNMRLIAKITPQAGEDYEEGDTCDIYRLSVDRPELVYKDAKFGTTYVDPYPTLGEFGGYRIVTRTITGDYITPENEIAWTDYTAEDGYGIDTMFNVIDFESGQVRLIYDIELDSSWSKDFQATEYLGGHVQGDWNPAVIRSGGVKGSLVTIEDQHTIQQLRRLAEYPGICHVRTRDGSSYAADVQVSETRDMGQDVIRSEFSLNITRVDAEGYDGETLDEYLDRTEGQN